ncbi:MAG: helix-turn-helix domain-containing protein [Candidatus Izemoplasmataceae bacterium]
MIEVDNDLLEIDEEELSDDEYLLHYGTPRHSGRYPWGSGDSPYQRSSDFLSRVEELKSENLSESKIAEIMGMSSTRLRALESLAKRERRKDLYSKAATLKKEGASNVEIADRLGLKGESTVRSLLNSDSKARMNIAEDLAITLKGLVDERGLIDIGVGVPRQLKVSREKMNQAIEILKMDGYIVHGNRVPQVTNRGKHTTLKVLCPPGTPHSAIYQYDKIKQVTDLTSYDNGKTLKPAFQYPASLDSARIQVRYAEDGGSNKDGVIELRRGVDDISLGTSAYSQVRILVDDTHYLKGMAVYSDNMPPGVDVIFNTNKSKSTPKMDTMKVIKDDPDNPFGSTIKETGGQSTYIDSNGKEQLSVINKRSDEGDWGEWSKEISAQFLSKQPQKLINRQIEISMNDRFTEFNEITSLTNPTVKKSLLISFADDCDAAAVSLKAAGLPGAKYKVILPVNSLKDNEVYAPHLNDGAVVALVRYPHGGTFEIPVLTVNNRNKEGINMMTTQASDAIGINSNVASIMSGADFDGDTVMAIPITDKIKIKSTPPLKDLKGFDTIMAYGPDEIKIIKGEERYFRGGKEYSILKETSTQNAMGVISNLITDMTLIGATNQELARAVKHSMVIIDANKHKLDYKQSEVDNGIKVLHKKYQSQVNEKGKHHQGAATLISKSKSKEVIGERKLGVYVAKDTGNTLTLIDPDNKIYFDAKTNRYYNEKEKKTIYINPDTGEKLYTYTDREYMTTIYKNSKGENKKASVITKDGNLYYRNEHGQYTMVTNEPIKIIPATNTSTKMAEVSDARELSSGTTQEEAYATYANQLKTLANESRKASLAIVNTPYSPSARASYSKEVDSLDFKLNEALLNAPKERQAQTIAASIIKIKKQDNPRMTNEEEKKMRQQELSKARIKVGAKRASIRITQEEWDAIQAGAISTHKLEQIMANVDIDILRRFAMPRSMVTLSPAKIRRIENMAKSGYTTAEIANALGVSTTTVTTTLKGD